MKYSLKAHDGTPGFAVEVELEHREAGLSLTYRVSGDVEAIVVPPLAPAVRTDELWRTTCFELFVQGSGEAYREYNFSPSGQWAAYAFERHREGMRAIGQDDPVIRARTDGEGLTVEVELPGSFEEGTRIGLTAIVERDDGSKSFWSLEHPDGPPDFHHETCFAATVPPIAAG